MGGRMFEIIFSGAIFGACALMMMGIGFTQRKSRTPVGFYTGEKPYKKEQIRDVKEWNQKHGMMWILYGCCFIAVWLCGLLLGDSALVIVPMVVGLVLPIIFMMRYHAKLVEQYVIKDEK